MTKDQNPPATETPPPADDAPSPPAGDAKPRRHRRLSGWGALAKLITIVLVTALLLHLFGLAAIPFPPFTTTGRIYVDSPEVYTRERLVNDRYDQDYWLRERLKLLDDPGSLQLFVGEEATGISGVIGDGSGDTPAAAPTVTPSTPRKLSFEQEFRVASGVRDMIRQQVLENMLDDRHDLTGNSVYGLKFDTTVVPGDNTRRRAFVQVRLTVEDLFSGGPEERARLADQKEQYFSWIEDLRRRLNIAEDAVYQSLKVECEADQWGDGYLYDKLTGKTLQMVLGIPEERYWQNLAEQAERTDADALRWDVKAPLGEAEYTEPTVVMLPDPWARFFIINRKAFQLPMRADEHDCRTRVRFDVSLLIEQFMVRRTGSADTPACEHLASNAEGTSSFLQLGYTSGGAWEIAVDPFEYEMREARFEEEVRPKFWPDKATIEQLADENAELCAQGRSYTPCPEDTCPYRAIEVPSGFLNFQAELRSRDLYPYAIFPKNDVVGVFADTVAELSAAAPATGLLDLVRRRSESTTASVLVGYGWGGSSHGSGDGRDSSTGAAERDTVDGRDSIEFGWVISSRDDMQPTQKSQLALVSVPAWTNTLNLSVTVGWLDRHGRPIRDDASSFDDVPIHVPPNLEALDSVFREDAQFSLGPTILHHEMASHTYLKVGQKKAKILIPGKRLWRSATVTLGAQAASRITVLPNMEGIIAEFDEVELPQVAFDTTTKYESCDAQSDDPRWCDKLLDPELSAQPVTLRVWTSEGVAKANKCFCLVYDPKNLLGPQPEEDQEPQEQQSPDTTAATEARAETENETEKQR